MVNWQTYPKNRNPTSLMREVAERFNAREPDITSASHTWSSNQVLEMLQKDLRAIGFEVEEKGKRRQIRMPVLFGGEGSPLKSFDVDAYHPRGRAVIEIEAGRAVTNHQFLKDLFEACMMHNVDYLIIAVRNVWGKSRQKDYAMVTTFMDTLYASERLKIPLEGIMIIGY